MLNRLAGQERAIVTDIAGTTRDILQETIVLNGLTLNLTDTAGLRQTDDIVEQAGIERARQAITQADLLLMGMMHREHEPLRLATELFGSLPNANSILMIANKIDLSDNHQNLPKQFFITRADLSPRLCVL